MSTLVAITIGISILGYLFMIMLVHAAVPKLWEFEDEFNEWLFSCSWPFSLIGALLWLVTHRLPGRVFKWYSDRKMAAEKRAKELAEELASKYYTVSVPHGEIDNLEEYRSLGQLVVDVKDKMTSYEIDNHVPISERTM